MVDALLASAGLSAYATNFDDEGYDDLDYLREIAQADSLQELYDAVGLSRRSEDPRAALLAGDAGAGPSAPVEVDAEDVTVDEDTYVRDEHGVVVEVGRPGCTCAVAERSSQTLQRYKGVSHDEDTKQQAAEDVSERRIQHGGPARRMHVTNSLQVHRSETTTTTTTRKRTRRRRTTPREHAKTGTRGSACALASSAARTARSRWCTRRASRRYNRIKWLPADGDDEALWRMHDDDGDYQDFDEEEAEAALRAFDETQVTARDSERVEGAVIATRRPEADIELEGGGATTRMDFDERLGEHSEVRAVEAAVAYGTSRVRGGGDGGLQLYLSSTSCREALRQWSAIILGTFDTAVEAAVAYRSERRRPLQVVRWR